MWYWELNWVGHMQGQHMNISTFFPSLECGLLLTIILILLQSLPMFKCSWDGEKDIFLADLHQVKCQRGAEKYNICPAYKRPLEQFSNTRPLSTYHQVWLPWPPTFPSTVGVIPTRKSISSSKAQKRQTNLSSLHTLRVKPHISCLHALWVFCVFFSLPLQLLAILIARSVNAFAFLCSATQLHYCCSFILSWEKTY